MFIGRKNELASLNERYLNDRFECAIIYGRRRVGKTELIKEFIKDKKHIFFSAVEGTERRNLDILSGAIYSSLSGKVTASAPKFDDFSACLEQIFDYVKNDKLIFVIDEYPYLAKSEPSVSSVLQHYIDHKFQHQNFMLILCGSSMSFMENQVMGYQSPLYGRRTCQYKILPFNFNTSSDFFSLFINEEKAVVHAITGGIPKYLLQFNDKKSLKQNIIDNFFTTSGFLYEEPQNLLKQELREPQTYRDIITAIAIGASKMKEIVDKVGIRGFDSAKCNKYLNSLISLGIVKREIPIMSKASSRNTIYRINDGMFRFWYRFVYNNTSSIEYGDGSLVYERINDGISDFMGEAFEDICKEYLWRLNIVGGLAVNFNDCGRWWGNNPLLKKEQEIDIIAYNKECNNAIFAECKWTNKKVDSRILKNLKDKSKMFDFKDKYYMLFAKSGFTEEAHEAAKRDKNVLLVSLKDI